MKTRYRYIEFVKIQPDYWQCRNIRHGEELGQAGWYPEWNRFVFMPTSTYSVYSDDCLQHIADFLQQLQAQREKVSL